MRSFFKSAAAGAAAPAVRGVDNSDFALAEEVSAGNELADGLQLHLAVIGYGVHQVALFEECEDDVEAAIENITKGAKQYKRIRIWKFDQRRSKGKNKKG